MDVMHSGYRGFGGYCLPKDLDSVIDFLDSLGVDADTLKSVRSQNQKILASQSLSQKKVSTHSYQNGVSSDPVERESPSTS
jgi:UDP-glucose 6-dehydrogenase